MEVEKLLKPPTLRAILLSESEASRAACVQVARFCAAYYLNYELYDPISKSFPSLYVWSCICKEDLPKYGKPLGRAETNRLMPIEFSPALPAILLVRCDHVVEAIGYVDNFHDRRSAVILRLLADSLYGMDLTREYILDSLSKGTFMEIDKIIADDTSAYLEKFTNSLVQSVLELEVIVQRGILEAYEQLIMQNCEYWFAQLPLSCDEESELSDVSIYEGPQRASKTSQEQLVRAKLHAHLHILLSLLAASNRLTQQLALTMNIFDPDAPDSKDPTQSCPQSPILPRVFLISLRMTYRDKFSQAVLEQSAQISDIASKYKSLLDGDGVYWSALQKWRTEASEDSMLHVSRFFHFIEENYTHKLQLPPLSSTTREVWLRKLLATNQEDYRDLREERHVDWLRGVCRPRHTVPHADMMSMEFINNQWTSPGFSAIADDAIALRLSLHPQDLCLTKAAPDPRKAMSAREPRAQPVVPEEKLFTPRDIISEYAQKARDLNLANVSQEPRYVRHSLSDKLREIAREQRMIDSEVDRESAFLQRTRSESLPSNSVKSSSNSRSLRQQLVDLNTKLDHVMQSLQEREHNSGAFADDDDESILESLPLDYEDAPVDDVQPAIEKLDLSALSPLPDVGRRRSHSTFVGSMSTARSVSDDVLPSAAKKLIPTDWMRLLPLEPSSERGFPFKLLLDDVRAPKFRLHANGATSSTATTTTKAYTERGVQTHADFGMTTEPKPTTSDSGFLEAETSPPKTIDGVVRMSRDEIRRLLDSR